MLPTIYHQVAFYVLSSFVYERFDQRRPLRLDAVGFKASRSQRKLVNRYAIYFPVTSFLGKLCRWNRFVIAGKNSDHMDTETEMYVNHLVYCSELIFSKSQEEAREDAPLFSL